MNPELPPNPRAELEARITALLLGELSADEAAALRRELAADPALAKLHDELQRTIGLVRETVAAPAESAASQPEPLKLSDERRAKLLAHFKTIPMPVAKEAPKRRRQPRDLKWLVPMSIAAALVVMLGISALLPSLAKSKAKSHLALIDDQVRLRLDLEGEGREAGRRWFWSEASGRADDAYIKRPTAPKSREAVGLNYHYAIEAKPGGQPAAAAPPVNSPQSGSKPAAEGGAVASTETETRRYAKLALPAETTPMDLFSVSDSDGDKKITAATRLMRESGGEVAKTQDAERKSRISGKDSGIFLPSGGQPLNEFQSRLGQIVNRAGQGSGDVRFESQAATAVDEAGVNRAKTVAVGSGGRVWRNTNAFVVNSGAVLGGASGYSLTLGGTGGITNAGTVLLNGLVTASDGFNRTDRGAITLNGGELRLGGGGQISNGRGTVVNGVANGGMINVDAASQLGVDDVTVNSLGRLRINGLGNVAGGKMINGTVAGSGNLTSTGSGRMFLGSVLTNGSAVQSGNFAGFISSTTVPSFYDANVNGSVASSSPGQNQDLLGHASVSTISGRQTTTGTDGYFLNGAVNSTYSLATDFSRDRGGMKDSALGDTRSLGRIVLPDTSKSDGSVVSVGQLDRPPEAKIVGTGGTVNLRTDVNNDYVGQTVISSGTTRNLALKGSEPLPALRPDGAERAEAIVKAGDVSAALPDPVLSSSSITKFGAGTLVLSGANTYSGGITVSNSTSTVAGNDAQKYGVLRLNGAGTLLADGANGYLGWNLNTGVAMNATSDPVAGERFKTFSSTSPAHPAPRPTAEAPLPEIAQTDHPTSQRSYYALGGAIAANPVPAPPAAMRPEPLPTPTPTVELEDLRRIPKSRVEAKDALADTERKLNQLKGLKGEALGDAAARGVSEFGLAETPKQPQSNEKKLAELTTADPRARPELSKAKKQVTDLQRASEQEAEKVVAGLEIREHALRANIEALDALAEGKKREDRETSKKEVAKLGDLAPQEERPTPKPPGPAPIPQPEISARENSFSTFSLNVSDVSFKLAAASLEQGQMPDPSAVRSEEFINAFDYRDPEALPGVPVAFAWERARYPFAHNRDLLRFSLKTAALGRQAGRAMNIVLLLDNSGSMERADRVRIVREALRVLAGQLQAQDKLSVITFARMPRLWVDGAAGDKAGDVFERVAGLTPEGGTNLEEAMNLGYHTALRHYLPGGINRVVLLTDGAANLGDVEPESLKAKVEAHRKQGVALDCFGIGWEGFNDDLLEVLSRNGDGRYGFINTPEEAATEFASQLAGALKVAASDVKVQVEFNPQRVTNWRQIGYAKHQLTKEQFRDNTVDAAEIAAQEAGNALYTVEVDPNGVGPLATVRIRFKIPGTSDYREHEWAVPFTRNVIALEHASVAMRLAATASAFSEWLVTSPFAGEVTPDRLLGYLSGVPETFGVDARPKKLEWMIRQAKSLSGK